ncbi:MAG: phage holin family protein [Clostridiaceae bacterium]|nr:phage holin family protein [Clostridiaceae bacterium]
MTTLMQYLLMCNILDIVTGFIKAYDQKNVSSKKMKHGALAKVSIWCVVVVSIILSAYLRTDLTTYIVGYYLIMEIISIVENASVFIPVPDKLKNMLDNEQVGKTEVVKEETVKTVDPEILKMIKEKKKNE